MFWNPKTLSHYFRYDPVSGHLYWKQKRRGRNLNKPAGSVNKLTKYVIVSHGGLRSFAHDLVWSYVTGKEPVRPIRHKNGHRWDNRFENLYEAVEEVKSFPVHPAFLSKEIIDYHLRYDPELGCFFWKERRQGRKMDVRAGSVDGKTRGWIISINGVPSKVEYLVWFIHNDEKPLGTIRHRNGDNWDNRIGNLYDDFFDFI
jgi:hypothetical protein